MSRSRWLGPVWCASVWFAMSVSAAAADAGWLGWRGPGQVGVTDEVGLPGSWEPGGEGQLFRVDLASRGAPVIARGDDGRVRLYAMGYRGEGTDLREVLVIVLPDSYRIRSDDTPDA